MNTRSSRLNAKIAFPDSIGLPGRRGAGRSIALLARVVAQVLKWLALALLAYGFLLLMPG